MGIRQLNKNHVNDMTAVIRGRETKLDLLVGKNIKLQRVAAGLSQRCLAEYLGVTFQQIQKVEQGKNRIGAGRLALVAEALKCPIDQLYADISDDVFSSVSSELNTLDLSLLQRLNALDPRFQRIIKKLINELAVNDNDNTDNVEQT
ncbi:MAG: helix-turn-helix transcriptional regulator [Pseudomonadota bacterium]